MLNKSLLSQIKKDLLRGKPIMLYDFPNRENETDLVYYGKNIDPKNIKDLRLNTGAPLTVYIDYETANKIGITTYVNFIDNAKTNYPTYRKLVKSDDKLLIDARFSITFDFRANKTGCSHLETAITVNQLAKIIETKKYKDFPIKFKSPGHVPLIISSRNLLQDRKGHSEMLLFLIKRIKLLPIIVASEMISPKNYKSMDYDEAKKYADKNSLIFLEGKDLFD